MGKKARRKTPGYKPKQARGSVITAYLLNSSDRSCLLTKVLIDPDDDCYAKIDYQTAAAALSPMAEENPEKRASAAQMLVKHFDGVGLSTPRAQVRPIPDP